jgi:ATP-dependent Clp protease, protease subunit
MPLPKGQEWLKITNKNADTGEIYIYGLITDEKWMEEDVTPTWFKDEIAKIGKLKNINLFINSPGGGVFAGLAIYNTIKRLSSNVVAYIDGLAASIASVIPMAASKIIMPKNALMMIHNPIGIAMGSAEDMRNEADLLDRVKTSIISTYAEKTKKDEKSLGKMMDAQTWMTGTEAVAGGFADVLDEEKKIAACLNDGNFVINGLKVNLDNFKTFPKDRFIAPALPANIRMASAREKLFNLKKEILV